MIVGGYLSKTKKPVPAGKFNAGQKTWYWMATLGGMIMILTGAAMYFLDFNIEMINTMTGLFSNRLTKSSSLTSCCGWFRSCNSFLYSYLYGSFCN